MTIDELFQELKAREVELWLDGSLLRFRAADGRLDASLLAQMRRHKAAIIEHLGVTTPGNGVDERVEPMSVGQEALYFLHTLARRSPAYNVASAVKILSSVDVDAMRQVLTQLVSRHELLRASFEARNGKLCCCVPAHGKVDFRELLLPGGSESQLREAVRNEYRRPFDLAKGPLFRARLFSVDQRQHVLLFTLHHIVFDFWSLWLILDEFRQLYAQRTTGTTALLPAPTASYFDFVRQQQEALTSERGERLWEYWSERLAGDLEPIELPCDFKRPDRVSLLGATHHFRIPNQLSVQLRQLAAEQGATPFMIMLALFNTLLHRYSGQHDLIVGITSAGRTSADFSQVVGYFVNTLAIRTGVADQPTFVQYLAQVKSRTLEAIAHQEFPFPKLIDRLNLHSDGGRQPICNAVFGLQKPQQFDQVQRILHAGSETVDWGGLEVQNYQIDQQEGQFDLTMELFDTGDSFLGAIKYDVELFAPESMVQLADHYLRLAEAVVADPNGSIADFDVVGPAERQQTLALAANGETGIPTDPRAHRLFEQTSRRVPNAIAAVSHDTSFTYDQLNRRANQLARLLGSHGVRPGVKVACCLQRGMDVPISLLAVLKAGGTYVPIDSANPPERSTQIIHQCGRDAVVLRSLPETKQDSCRTADSLNVVILQEHREHLLELDDTDLKLDFPAETLAYTIFTSGSTGQPKGVVVTHRAIAEHIVSICHAFGLTERDRVLQFSNLGFDPSLEQMLAPWSLGASVVIRGEQLWTPDQFWKNVAHYELTVANLPPAYFRECSADFARNPRDIVPLRLLIIGGDEFPAETLEVWRGRAVRILNAYGPTEAVITATVFDATNHQSLTRRVPIGRTKPGMRAYVLDNRRRLAPIGTVGELYLAGRALADGYLGDPELTTAKFQADPFSDDPASRMYRTGDRARWSIDGTLEFLGRTDRQIKINGFRVETGEIESILGTSPAVRQCHVQMTGGLQGEHSLVAWVVPVEGSATSHEELRTYLKARLPSYAVPRQFVFLHEMPIGVSGKIDTSALPAPPVARSLAHEFVPPRNEIEEVLAGIWSDTLGVTSIGVHDSFFDLGGGSLTSLRIASRVTETGLVADGQQVEPELLFRFPTIGELAAKLQKRVAG